MVQWFDPAQLAGTAVQVVLSSIFGAYSDKREIQVALAPNAKPHDEYASRTELWFDYVADLGDGFEPTYTVAYLLARPTLELERDGRSWTTQRGGILVMGGDQVYPTATRTGYENRLVGPYRAALPYVGGGRAPHLYAIPGNHDWYDGLTNFIRSFCRRQWVGGWATRQERSYFAVQLPHRWWLWAIDIQFDTYIDEPQLAYFQEAKNQLLQGDRLILLTGKPSWTESMKPHPEPSYANLAYFEDQVLKDKKATIELVVSGDFHHYARYENASGDRHRITSGGGGAYLYPTHHLQPTIELDEGRGESTKQVTYALQAAYPPPKVTSRQRWLAAWRLPIRNRRLLPVLGAVYFGPALLLQIPVRRNVSSAGDVALSDVLGTWLDAMWSPWLLVAAMVLAPLFVLFAAGRSVGVRFLVGLPHAAVQLALVSFLVALSAWLLSLVDLNEHGVAIAALAAVLAVLPGAWLLGLYLSVCDLVYGLSPERFKGLDRHANETFSCQRIEDWKSFLRFHIDAQGRLTIFPIGVDRVARKKELSFNPGGDDPEAPYYMLSETIRPRLIENPVQVPKTG
jgi:hypothetical protein